MNRTFLFIYLIVCLLPPVASLAQKKKRSDIEALQRQLTAAPDDTGKVNLLLNLANACRETKPAKALIYARQALDLSQQLGWKSGSQKSCNALGTYSVQNHDYSVAADYYSRSMKLAEELGDERSQCDCARKITVIYTGEHDYARALDFCSRYLKLAQVTGDKKETAAALKSLAEVYAGKKDFNSALDNYRQAQRLYEELGAKNGIAGCLAGIGNLYASQKDYADALDYATRALAAAQNGGDNTAIAVCEMNLGNIFNGQNDHERALGHWLRAVQLFPPSAQSYLSLTYQNMAALYRSGGDYVLALASSAKAYKLRESTGDHTAMSVSLANMGSDYQAVAAHKNKTKLPDSLASLTDTELQQRAIACYKAAIVYQKEREDFDLLSSIYQGLSQAQAAVGDSAGSRESFRKYNNYLAGVYSPDKRKDISMGDMQDVFVQKQENMQEQMERNALEYEYEKKQALARTELERQQLKYEEELKEKQITYDYQQQKMQLEQKMAIEKKEQEKREAVKAEQVIEARNQRNFTLLGFATLGIITLGIYNRYAVLRRLKRLLESKNEQIAREKDAADQMRMRAENSEKFKQQFLANMSHEIRTPMNAVSGMTALLLDKNPRTDQAGYLQAISKSADILLHIINDILDLSKIQAGKMELESIDFSLPDTLNQVRDTLLHKAEDKGLQLAVEIDDNVPGVLVGDPYRLNQVLINLGGNAIKFTERGGVELRVRKESETDGKVMLQFSVTDTGIGIPADKLGNLFTDFAQVNASDTRKYGGTGLGLSISRQLVELQGGRIWAESTEGRGTTFAFTIAYRTGSREKLLQQAMQEKHADGSALDGLRILVADDNEYNRLVVQDTLHLKASVTIDMAVNGQEAVNKVQAGDYDVVLMDVQMPVMNGIDATKYIRSKLPPPRNSIPIVALTASILRHDIDRCLESGMNSYVPKPFKTWQLISALADATGRKMAAPIMPDDAGQAGKFAIEPENGSLTDFTYLRKFCEGDEARMKKYISLYLTGVPVFKEKMAAAVAGRNLTAVAHQVHGFKPNWMIMGMKKTSELGMKIESQCHAGNENAYENVKLLIEQTDRSVVELGGTAEHMTA